MQSPEKKIRLGRAWQDAAGKQAYRYYMVFQNKDLNMEGAYRFDEFLTLLRNCKQNRGCG